MSSNNNKKNHNIHNITVFVVLSKHYKHSTKLKSAKIKANKHFPLWLGKCSPNPCLNGGECEEKRDKFKCKCPMQFVGRRCQRGMNSLHTTCSFIQTAEVLSFEKHLMFVLGKRVCKRGTCGAGLCLLTPSPPYYKCKCIPPFAPPNCRTSKTYSTELMLHQATVS